MDERKIPKQCTGLSVSEYDFTPFQPTSQRTVNGVSTFQYSHSGDDVAKDGRMPGAEFMNTRSDREQGHSIRNFYDLENEPFVVTLLHFVISKLISQMFLGEDLK